MNDMLQESPTPFPKKPESFTSFHPMRITFILPFLSYSSFRTVFVLWACPLKSPELQDLLTPYPHQYFNCTNASLQRCPRSPWLSSHLNCFTYRSNCLQWEYPHAEFKHCNVNTENLPFSSTHLYWLSDRFTPDMYFIPIYKHWIWPRDHHCQLSWSYHESCNI